MGYYIDVPKNTGKMKQLMELYDAKLIGRPRYLRDVPPDKALICVVDNGLQEAAVYCYSQGEFEVFSNPDGRPRMWLLMDLAKTQELTGYNK